MATKLANMAIGSVVTLNENGSPNKFYVLTHDYESELNGEGRTLLVRVTAPALMYWGTSNYSEGIVDTWLNDTYRGRLDPDIQECLGTTFYSATAATKINNYGNTAVTDTLQRDIFILSARELGVTASSIADGSNTYYYAVEGSKLSVASVLKKVTDDSGEATTQWTRSISQIALSMSSAESAIKLDRDGAADPTVFANNCGVRPALTLPAELYVLDDGTITTNVPPAVSSATENGGDLGVQNDGFNFTYSISDKEGDAVTVSEYLDGVLKRTFEATLGETYTFDCTTVANFQKILNGTHTLEVVANDGKADSEAYTVTFTKKVTSASVTLGTPIEADDTILVTVAAIVGSLPSDVVVEVLVTNNANDDDPAWEDATSAILAGENHVFTNQTAGSGFAFNFKLNVSRGESDEGGYITNIGGAFQ